MTTLHRFFVDPSDVEGDDVPVPASIEHQVRRVLRLRDGDRIVLLTGDGSEAVCRLDGSRCVIELRRPVAGEPAHRLTIVQALLRGDGLETVVEQGTELGVVAFHLVVTARCVARDLGARKLERLRAIAREAAEQSERGIVPEVREPVPLAETLLPGAVLLAERRDAPRLGQLPDAPTVVIVGPEGGFTDAEVAAAAAASVPAAGLGPRILRARTVAAAVAAAVLSRTGDFA